MTDSARGILTMVLAMACFAVGDAAIVALGPVMGPGTILTALGLGGTAVFAAVIAATRTPVPWRLALHPVVMGRNLIEIVGVVTVVTSLTLLPLTLVTSIKQSSPIIAMAGAALFLGEHVGPRRWVAVGVAMTGVLLMVSPWESGTSPAVLLPLIGSASMAARDILTRRIPEGVPNTVLALWGNIAVTPAGIVLALALGDAVPQAAPGPVALMALAIAFAAAGYYAVTAAVRLAPVPVVVPFRYVRIVFAAGIGILLFSESPGPEVWAGAALVVGAGLYALRAGPVPLPRPAR